MASKKQQSEEQASEQRELLEGSFLMRKCWQEQIALLNSEQKALFIDAVFNYQCNGEDFKTSDGMLKMLWANVKQIFDFNNKRYAETCRKNSENAKKRWSKNNATASDRMRANANDADNDIDIDNEGDNDNDIDI